ncbi:sulfurtransferase, partial [Streptomyces sp. 8L]|nr:sulfurtransferase [Streptomyces sp. 8L]
MTAIITASDLSRELSGERPPVLLDVRWQLSTAAAGGPPRAPGPAPGPGPPPPRGGGGARPPPPRAPPAPP